MNTRKENKKKEQGKRKSVLVSQYSNNMYDIKENTDQQSKKLKQHTLK